MPTTVMTAPLTEPGLRPHGFGFCLTPTLSIGPDLATGEAERGGEWREPRNTLESSLWVRAYQGFSLFLTTSASNCLQTGPPCHGV